MKYLMISSSLKKKAIFLLIVLLFLIVLGRYHKYNGMLSNSGLGLINVEKHVKNDINSHYNKFVITNKEAVLYDENKVVVGRIGKGIILELADLEISDMPDYFKINNLPGYYIKYSDVNKGSGIIRSNHYKRYIPFNKRIKTNGKLTLYDKNKKLVYMLKETIDAPVIVNDKDYYGIVYDNQVLYVKKNEIRAYDSKNTDKHNASGVAVLNYHFFYNENIPDEVGGCQESICASAKQFRSHLEYFKNNNILTITMDELEMYMDGKIQLPKSVLITIDDGGRTKVGIDLLTEYKMNGTIFLITSWYNPKDYYKTDYIELHSHSHNLHNGGKCYGGQGAEIKCLNRATILADLKKSRNALDGSRAFCYPFYEYNNYSEKLVKEAGFTMAFIGEEVANYGPYKLAEVGGNKMRIPRFVVVKDTTISELNRYFNEIR